MLGNDAKETAKVFEKTLKSLENAKKQLFSSLNEEQLKEIAPAAADFTRVMQAAKDGNIEELNKYISQYANIN